MSNNEKKTVTAGPMILNFDVKDIKNIFFTSDLHFNHAKIIEYCRRPFSSVEEMNEVLLKNINDTIGNNKDAILINCGDFILGKNSEYEEFIDKIQAKKIYHTIGNHDLQNLLSKRSFVPYDPNAKDTWSSEIFIRIFKNNKLLRTFTVSHFPHCMSQFMGSFCIHGHLHTPANLEDYAGCDVNIAKTLKEKRLTYDVGVDGNDYKPVQLTDILTGQLKMWQIKDIDFSTWNTILSENI